MGRDLSSKHKDSLDKPPHCFTCLVFGGCIDKKQCSKPVIQQLKLFDDENTPKKPDDSGDKRTST